MQTCVVVGGKNLNSVNFVSRVVCCVSAFIYGPFGERPSAADQTSLFDDVIEAEGKGKEGKGRAELCRSVRGDCRGRCPETQGAPQATTPRTACVHVAPTT